MALLADFDLDLVAFSGATHTRIHTHSHACPHIHAHSITFTFASRVFAHLFCATSSPDCPPKWGSKQILKVGRFFVCVLAMALLADFNCDAFSSATHTQLPARGWGRPLLLEDLRDMAEQLLEEQEETARRSPDHLRKTSSHMSRGMVQMNELRGGACLLLALICLQR
jgi:hypothetical protein